MEEKITFPKKLVESRKREKRAVETSHPDAFLLMFILLARVSSPASKILHREIHEDPGAELMMNRVLHLSRTQSVVYLRNHQRAES